MKFKEKVKLLIGRKINESTSNLVKKFLPKSENWNSEAEQAGLWWTFKKLVLAKHGDMYPSLSKLTDDEWEILYNRAKLYI